MYGFKTKETQTMNGSPNYNYNFASTRYLCKPDETEGHQPMEYSMPLSQSSHMRLRDDHSKKRKKGLWKRLFGSKNCNYCEQRKSGCVCQQKMTKTRNFQSQTELRYAFEQHIVSTSRIKEYGTSRIIQTNPHRSHPLAERGCGLNLYFCVDRQRKKLQMRNREMLLRDSRPKRKICKSPLWENKCCPTGVSLENKVNLKDRPTLTILCESANDNKVISHTDNEVKHIFPKTNEIDNFVNKSQTTITFLHQPEDTNIYQMYQPSDNDVFQKKKEVKEKAVQTDLELLNNVGINSKIGVQNFEVNYVKPINAQKESPFASAGEENITYQLEIGTNVGEKQHKTNKQKRISVLKQNGDKKEIIDKNRSDNADQSNALVDKNLIVNINDPFNASPFIVNDNNGSKNVQISENKMQTSDDQEFANKQRKSIRRSKLWKQNEDFNFVYNVDTSHRDSVFSKKSFGRSSIVTISKRRNSQFDNMIGLILDKLNYIEEKLENLEKDSDDQNIIMGISRDSKRSRVCIQLKTKQNAKTDQPLFTSMKTEDRAVEINTPQKDDIFVYTPQEVINKQKKMNNFNNSVEMNVNRTGSNIKTFKCKNPVILIETGHVSDESSRPFEAGEMWRRISEELKVPPKRDGCCKLLLDV